MHALVLFGNRQPMMTRRDGSQYPAPHISQAVTRVELHDDHADPEYVELALSTDNDRTLTGIAERLGEEYRAHAVAVREVEDIVRAHAAGVAPDWVACEENPELEAALAAHFRCSRGEPKMGLTAAGRDALILQHLTTGTQPGAFNYIGLTADSSPWDATHVALPGELAAGGGGLNRGQGSVAHTLGTNTATLTRTFVANSSDALPVTVLKSGIFNAPGSGTLGYESPLTGSVAFNVPGDSGTITATFTGGP